MNKEIHGENSLNVVNDTYLVASSYLKKMELDNAQTAINEGLAILNGHFSEN